MYNTKKATLVVALLCATSGTHSINAYHNDSFWSDLGKGVAAVGGVVVGAYALKALFNPSDERLIRGGYDLCSQAQAHFPFIDAVGAQGLGEPGLYTIARQWFTDGADSFEQRLGALKCLGRSLESQCSSLAHRRAKIAARRDGSYATIDTMQRLENDLQAWADRVNYAINYLRSGRAYFELYEHEVRLMNRYKGSLHALEQHGYNVGALHYEVHCCVKHRAQKTGAKYAYISYVQKIGANLDTLHDLIEQSYEFPNRQAAAHELLSRLEAVERMVVGSPEYEREKLERERARMEQERIEIEKERLKVEKKRLELERKKQREEKIKADRERQREREARFGY